MAKPAEAETGSDTRGLILRAALQAFAELGFDGASTREIANRAGVNHGLIRYYFGGKPNLWKQSVDLAFAELEAGLEAAQHDETITSDRERLRLMIRNFVRFVGRRPEFVLLMHQEGKRKGPRMRWLVDRHVKPIYEAISAIAMQSRESGVFRLEIPPIHLHYILAGSVSFIFHQAEECKRLSGVDPFDEAVIEEHARIVEQLLLGPPRDSEDPKITEDHP